MGGYRERVDALEAVWACWAEIGAGLSEQQWSRATRCPGWDVAALYAHVGMFPAAVADPPAGAVKTTAAPVTAVEILRGFNAPGGVAHEMADQVAHAAVATASSLDRAGLIGHYADDAPRAVAALRDRGATSLVPWPGANAVTTWDEAVRIVLMESVVHLLDVLDGLERAPEVPAAALRETVHLLAEIAEPVSFIEAATGRIPKSPLPVLR
ncbi:maleylpyruvate isomerase N-terminal domain-containing protein [Saccharopolyspora shandongensis]|uniref:TIGR03083 family protein n=1 Tax=Saccharopolyspora shandongensis TaxID=418495 RepID=A0A1H3M2J2_9PSEU|nr:maleylpyruvate isomerase N-terminal domain-containing protein [Saccharopolyspora shandongensis]SDY70930.1 TIGR03083 family protein [Saccharopolyspora shandongensis]